MAQTKTTWDRALEEPFRFLGQTYDFSLKEFLAELIMPLVGLIVLAFVVYFVLTRLVFRKKADKASLASRKQLKTALFILTFFLSLATIIQFISPKLDFFATIFTKPFFSGGGLSLSLFNCLEVLIVFYAALKISEGIQKLLERQIVHKTKSKDIYFPIVIIRYIVLIIIFLVGLAFVGINVSSLGIALGVLGVGAGFSLQPIAANFLAGIILVAGSYIREGDAISVGETFEGEVQKVKALSTIIKTQANEIIIIPNTNLLNEPIFNYTHNDSIIWIQNKVQVAYGSNLDEVLKVLIDTGKHHPDVVQKLPPFGRVLSFDASGITVSLGSLVEASTAKETFSSLNLAIYKTFLAHHIEIPYPQLVIQEMEKQA